MYYYPETLPELALDKVKNLCGKSQSLTRLYSDEGIFQIKNAKIKRLHFDDDVTHGKKISIGSHKFICDKSKVKFIPTNKIPYSFEKRETLLYSKGRMGIEIDPSNNRTIHLFFDVESPNIYGIEEEITEYMRNICAKV